VVTESEENLRQVSIRIAGNQANFEIDMFQMRFVMVFAGFFKNI